MRASSISSRVLERVFRHGTQGVGEGRIAGQLFDEQDGGKLVLDELIRRDADGRKRIWLNGSDRVLLDANGKPRIIAATLPDASCRGMLKRTDDADAVSPAIHPLRATACSPALGCRSRSPWHRAAKLEYCGTLLEDLS